MRNVDNWSHELLQLFQEVVNSFVNELAPGQSIVKLDDAILRYMQPAKTKQQQFADDLSAESCKVADVFDERTLKDVYIKGVESSIRNGLRHYRTQNHKANLEDIALQP